MIELHHTKEYTPGNAAGPLKLWARQVKPGL
jgi:hypothetical protein